MTSYTPSRRTSRHKLPRLLTALVLIAVVATFPAGWGPRLATGILRRSPLLRAFPELTFQVNHLSHARAVLSGIQFAAEEGAPRVERLEIDYSLFGLCHRSIDAVRVTGLAGTVLVGSNNQVVVPGLERWPLVDSPGRSPPAGRAWRVLSGDIHDIGVTIRSDGEALDAVTGSLWVAGMPDGSCRLAWKGSVVGIPAWLAGEWPGSGARGRLAFVAPRVTGPALAPAVRIALPLQGWPAIGGAVTVSAVAEWAAGALPDITLLVQSVEELIWPVGGGNVRLHPVTAGGQWTPAAEGRGGRLRDVTLEAVVAGCDGLPGRVAQSLPQAELTARLADADLPPDPSHSWEVSGGIRLPSLLKGSAREAPQVAFTAAVATNRIALQLRAPSIEGSVLRNEAPVQWHSGELAVNMVATQQVRNGVGGWQFAADAGCSGGGVEHPGIVISNAALRLPLAGWVSSATNHAFRLEPLRPRIGWETALVHDHPVTIGDLPIETADDDGIVRVLGKVQLDAPGLFNGRVGVEMAVDLRPGSTTPWRCRVTLDDGALTLQKPVALELQGVRTALSLEADSPGGCWRLLPVEGVFERAVLAGIGIDGGRVRGRIDADELLVERAEFGWCGGTLRMYAVRADRREPDVDFVLYAEQLDAGALLALIKPLHGTATGRLYGRIPLRVQQGKVRLSEGFLYALPGETGRLQLDDTPFLRDYLARTGLPATVQQKMIATLADLNYDVFRVDLSAPSAREARLVLKLAGKAAHDERLPPVELDIRINGPLEALLNFGLQVNSGAP